MSENIIGIVAGTCTAVSLLPQLVKLLKEKKAEQLSFLFLFILLAGQGLWIWYGILREDPPIIVTNAVSAFLNVGIIVFGYKYQQRE